MKSLLFLLCLFCSGCGIIPTRIFQAKVPAPLGKTAEQLEAERQAADLLARTLTFAPLQRVAQGLSVSLGYPKKPVELKTPEELPKVAEQVTQSLQVAVVANQKQVEKLNVSLGKLQGKEIEGTGLSLAGPGALLVVGIFVALGVLCPGVIIPFMGMAYRRLKNASKVVVNELEEAGNAPETKAAVASIKKNISKAMKAHPQNTDALKNVVLDLKKS